MLPTSSSWSSCGASERSASPGALALDIVSATRSELGRRARNEDRVCVRRAGPRWLGVVADGAGGHQGGAEAARRAVERLPQALDQGSPAFGCDALSRAVLAAHHHVRDGQRQDEGVGQMHTTVVALWVDTGSASALWAHVGDSRLYAVRQGTLHLLTSDDSVVQRMVEAGVLTPEQALVHPNRSQLIAALGIDNEVEPHTLREAAPLEAGDVFLLCSDGWWGALADDQILASLAGADTPEAWLAAMQLLIQERGQPRQDNFSAIAAWVVRAGDAEGRSPPG